MIHKLDAIVQKFTSLSVRHTLCEALVESIRVKMQWLLVVIVPTSNVASFCIFFSKYLRDFSRMRFWYRLQVMLKRTLSEVSFHINTQSIRVRVIKNRNWCLGGREQHGRFWWEMSSDEHWMATLENDDALCYVVELCYYTWTQSNVTQDPETRN